ncbi:MAG: hypothetical protein HY924_14995, partial [Elusimicrobia bacterium]|nr:hypothetical protein [Elusimicrobiota bacterium]
AATDSVNPRVLRAGDTMTGQLTIANSTLTVTGNAFSVGVSTLVVKDGRLGVGTTGPDSVLHVTESSVDPSVWTLHLQRTNHVDTNIRFQNNIAVNNSWNTGIYDFGGDNFADFYFWNPALLSQAMVIDGATNDVGIGVTNPGSRLHASVNDAAANAVTSVLRLDHATTGAPAAGIGAGLKFIAEDAGGSMQGAAEVHGILTDVSAGAELGAMRLLTKSAGGLMTEKVRIDTLGRVGVNTTDPQSMLHVVNGDIRISTTDALSHGVIFKDGTTQETAALGGNLWADRGSNNVSNANTGKVGIGITDPSFKLDVSGALNVSDDGGFFQAGSRVLSSTNTGTFVGADAGLRNQAGGLDNVFVGSGAGDDNTIGDDNTFVGYSAGDGNQTGIRNVFIGSNAGASNSVGSRNIFLGYQAGFSETGSDKLYIDNSNTASPLLWGDFAANAVNINGSLGLGITNPSQRLHVVGGRTLLQLDDSMAVDIYRPNSAVGMGAELAFSFNNAGAAKVQTGSVMGVLTANVAGLESGGLALYTRDNGVFNEKVRLTSDGKLGIGTTDPTEGGAVGSKLTVRQAAGGTGLAVMSDTGARRLAINPETNGASLHVGNALDTAWIRAIDVYNDGNVGIGTSAPATKLDVVGDAQFGSGPLKSTFTATPGPAAYALQLSSGATLANGGPLNFTTGGYIRFPDGKIQTTAYGGKKALFKDVKAQGTDGGASAAATWNIRTLNTVDFSDIPGASLAANQITLPAGTYRVKASAPCQSAGDHKLALYNVTDGAPAVIGTSEFTNNGAQYASSRSEVWGQFTIAAQKVFELRHYTLNTQAGNGLGRSTNAAGYSEVFAVVEIEQMP